MSHPMKLLSSFIGKEKCIVENTEKYEISRYIK